RRRRRSIPSTSCRRSSKSMRGEVITYQPTVAAVSDVRDYWLGKMSGRQYPESLGKLHFWLTFIGVNLTFFPMHFLGVAGMPRRIPDYPDAFAGWNMVASVGALISAASVVVFFYLIYKTFTSGAKAGDNPWGEGATTLEWTVPSPPPFHTFNELPQVK
ncbi:MAG: cbb3-type cytochrome c oxidase subunit I, partial [Geminicoccaceae bacterium]